MPKSVQLLAVICVLCSPTLACLNDTAVDRGEKEFRSQYDQPAKSSVQIQAGMNPWSLAALSVGGGLATGSLIVAWGRRRRGVK